MNVKKFLGVKFLGNSTDFREAHWENEVLMDNGETKIMYSTSITNKNGSVFITPLTEFRPFIGISAEEIRKRIDDT
jgi:hypothetical protein